MRILTILILAIGLMTAPVYAEDLAKLEDDALFCQNIFGPFVLQHQEMLINGLVEEDYGHTADSPVIIKTMSIPTAMDDPALEGYYLSIPLFYVIDLDSDGVPEKVLINRMMEREDCTQLENLNEQETVNPEMPKTEL